MMRRMFTACFLVLTLPALARQNDSLLIRAIADEILVNGKAYENLRVLTKQVGARLSGSPAMYKAEAWGKKTLEQSGAEKVWLQECMVPHWVRGGKDEAYIAGQPKNTPLDVLALGNSVGTGAKGVKAPVVLINSFDELEQRKDEVKGKIVFYNYKFNNKFVKTFNAYGDAGKYRGMGPSRAAKYGAVAVLVRSMSNAADNNPHTGSTVYNDSFPKIPAAAVGLQDADKLAALLNSNKSATVYLKTLANMLPDTIGHNVIGEWKGSEFPEQIITIGGHLDSWDPAEGAHDDGAGCVQSIEVLRALKAIGYKPKRTIRVVLFANEENGLRGGTKYAQEAKAKGEQHYFAMESDEGGFTPRGFGITATPEQLAKIRTWTPLFEPYGVFELEAGYGGADIGPLNQLFKTPLAGLEPDSQRYFDIHHARSDVFEAVNKRELELGAVNMAALIYLVDKYGL
ncbi:M20/M25/M40 family metallo-hydrolase [Paraflavitalea sp. CAU 1676]|uniref:M20/M25/M40 family metallo-hydrolase n=1 Tax=Paraflavitalea sp. CAU 1676 TaxID=3032598 RepID=UPI0023DAD0F5|nr:M20/M25/M40 family metallo-hydrolase [Paraflavitalea sp. CAU 1676]MDF2193055.1 M20/M25/M40 family metallo-hydrolase [Paraflavitalea sp. CAU 1676]